MTEEMSKEDFFRQNFSEYCVGDTFLSPYWDLFEAGYELKQNNLSQHILDLQKDKGELTDRVKELEAQIEKMKNWCNCKNYQQCLIELAEQGKGMKPSECCVNCKKWELANDKRRTETRTD